MESYKLEQKLDIIISMLNNNMEVIRMAKCPYCRGIKSIYSDFNAEFDVADALHNEHKKRRFFQEASLVNCHICNKYFYVSCYVNKLDNEVSIEKEFFEELKYKYDDNLELVNYLPEPLKESYRDALLVFVSPVSDKHKLGATRLIIEEYLRYTNGVDEADRIRLEINKIEDKELRSGLHKIVDENIKALHAKKELPTMEAKKALKTLELLFTLLYKLPKDYEKLQREYRQKRENMESQFSNILKNL